MCLHDHLPGTYLDTSLLPPHRVGCFWKQNANLQVLGSCPQPVWGFRLLPIISNLGWSPKGLPAASALPFRRSSLLLPLASEVFVTSSRGEGSPAGSWTYDPELKSQICLETSMWELSLLKNHRSDEGGLQKHMSFEPVSVSGEHTPNIMNSH